MFGNNPKLPFVKGDGLELEVQEIFSTFQGEGIFIGYPAIFIRLGGCNLACSFCDTEFDSYHKMHLSEIVREVNNLARNVVNNSDRLIVITGGEPLRQPLMPLCDSLLDLGWQVQIETNGTFFQDLPKEVHIICSPKNNNGAYQNIREDLLPRISAFKFLISAGNPSYQLVPEIGQADFNTPVYLQPIDEYDLEKNQANLRLAVELARRHNYRLSLQAHKIWGVK